MWPWEHAVVGYLAFSTLVHLFDRRSPTGREAIVVGLASVLPDLIDKPLAWEFGVFQSGYGIGHSVFLAVPVSVAVFALAAYYRRTGVGAAFAAGYLFHIPADVFARYVRDSLLPFERVLWPVAKAPETEYPGGLSGTFVEYFTDYLGELFAGDPGGYTLGVLGLIGFCLLLWLYDGMPGIREPIVYLWRR